jgi:metallo-beta-lactamase class B
MNINDAPDPRQPRQPPADWTTPMAGHRIAGNLYAVGTYDLSVYLIATDAGHIMINTGVSGSTALIQANMTALGFDLEDIQILLTMQAHWDHTASLAEIKRLTGARMFATDADTRILEDGGFSDPHFGGAEMFEPISVDDRLNHGNTIDLGGTSLKVHWHPGHTEGSASYTMSVAEDGHDLSVVIANMGTINKGKRLIHDPTYPGVADDFAETFRRQRELRPDIWVAAHASHYRLHEKYVPGIDPTPEDFLDPTGYAAAIDRLEDIYVQQVAAERSAGRR